MVQTKLRGLALLRTCQDQSREAKRVSSRNVD
jgi:hypothetical protein